MADTVGTMKPSDVYNYFGGQSATARQLGIYQSSVAEWKERGVPWQRQLQIEHMTRGALKHDPSALPKHVRVTTGRRGPKVAA